MITCLYLDIMDARIKKLQSQYTKRIIDFDQHLTNSFLTEAMPAV